MTMRKITSASIAILMLLLLTILPAAELVDANPFPPTFLGYYMNVTIYSPSNQTYALPILVNFSASSDDHFYLRSDIGEGGGEKYSGDFYYVLDGQNMTSSGVKILQTNMSAWHYFRGQASLTDLAPGPHNITVYWGVRTGQGILNSPYYSATSQFYVDPQFTPQPAQTAMPLNSPTQSMAVEGFSSLMLPLVAAGVAVAVVTVTGLVVYYRRKDD